jgi:hypothetical protein
LVQDYEFNQTIKLGKYQIRLTRFVGLFKRMMFSRIWKLSGICNPAAQSSGFLILILRNFKLSKKINLSGKKHHQQLRRHNP